MSEHGNYFVRKLLAVALWMLFAANVANAIEGPLDREAEVQQYLRILSTNSKSEITRAAKEIYSSGITDDRLAKAINEKLLATFRDLAPPPDSGRPLPPFVFRASYGEDGDYGVWMCRALVSFGDPHYAATFTQIGHAPSRGGAKWSTLGRLARRSIDDFEWHKQKNEIMASAKLHQPGDNPRATGFLNLFEAGGKFKSFALDRIVEEEFRDARVNAFLATEVEQYLNDHTAATRQETNAAAAYVRILGLSADAQFRPLLQRVLAADVVPGLRRRAEDALEELKFQCRFEEKNACAKKEEDK